MRVNDVMTAQAVTCRTSDTLAQAAQLMWDHDCGCIPIVDDDQHVVGMVTDRDVCMAGLHAGQPLREIQVHEAMAHDPVTCRPDDDVSEAQEVMGKARVRRLPVTDAAGRLVGVLSLHDLALAAAQERRWFSGVTMRDVARTFAEVSRPWTKPSTMNAPEPHS